MAQRLNGTIRNSALTWAFAIALAQVAGTTASLAQNVEKPAEGASSFLDALAAEQADNGQQWDGQGEGEWSSDEPVAVNEDFFVELHVADDDLATVLEMLSIQSQRNIIMSSNVSATVTANLYGVTFYEALDAILNVNGFGYVEQGNFIYVYTKGELEEIIAASRVRTSEVIRLNYLSAVDAAEFVSPLLSEAGVIQTNARTEDFQLGEQGPVGKDDYALDAMLVVHDYEENVDQIRELVTEIDTRPAQVLVEATILQSELTENNAFGIDFSLVDDLNITDFVDLGGPLGAAEGLITGAGANAGGTTVPAPAAGNDAIAVSSNYSNISGPATLKAGIVNGDFALFLRVLDEVSDTTILSNPKVLSLNRQPARVLVGRKVGYLSTTSTDTSTTQTVEFLDTGTQLYFRPFVTNDGLIRMELKPQVSEAVIRTVTDVSGAGVTIPDEITNELTANVMVRDGQTIVLGGLFREQTQTSRRQVPVLGDIPWIGAAFRGQEDETKRAEVIFMVKPTRVSDEALIEQGERASEYVDNVRTGSRKGVLIFSRERRAAQLLVDAQRLAREGKTRRALHCIQRSLELKPMQPDAIALRTALMNKAEIWPSGSMLEDIMNGETDEIIGRASRKEWMDSTQKSADDSEMAGAEDSKTPFDRAGHNGAQTNAHPSQQPADQHADDPFWTDPTDGSAESWSEPSADAGEGFVNANPDGTYDASFSNVSVKKAAQWFADASGHEFVVDGSYPAAITTRFTGAGFDDAMAWAFNTAGYVFIEHDGAYHVMSVEQAGSFLADMSSNASWDSRVKNGPLAIPSPFGPRASYRSYNIERHMAGSMDPKAPATFPDTNGAFSGLDLTEELEAAAAEENDQDR